MCRIFGAINDNAVMDISLTCASKAMLSGGPDCQWIERGNHWAVGTNRLAIQGVDGGQQPFKLNNRVCVFNGEIYNHRELRVMLIDKGYSFVDACDGNVVLPLYQEYGAAFLSQLEGMFALAILDLDSDGTCISAFLAADQSAMKTLFYAVYEGGLYFASSLKALQALSPKRLSLREEFVYEFVSQQAIWGPDTVYDGVKVLGAGETLAFCVKTGQHQIGHYKHAFPQFSFDGLDNAADQFDDLLHAEIIRMAHMDVDFCAVLSGGLDSSYITALLRKHTDRLEAFHIGYDGNWPGDESHFARMVAEENDITLHDIKVDTSRIPEYVSEYIQHLDQPNFAPHCLSTYFLFKEIGRSGYKVAFTGEGADELFCGYGRLIQAATSTESNWFDTFYARYGVNAFRNGQYFKRDYLDQVASSVCAPSLELDATLTRAQNVLTYDTKERFPYYILRRVDSLSMASSVEVRMPFLQPRVIDFARQLPDDLLFSNGVGKQCVLRAGERYLPRAVIHRDKQPFTFPIQQMMAQKGPLRDYIFDTVCAQDSVAHVYFDMARIERFKDRDLTEEDTSVLWALLVLQEWHSTSASTPSL